MPDPSLADLSTAEWAILAPGLCIVIAVSAWLSVIDWREHRLPNRIVGPLAAGVAAWIVVLGLATNDFGRSLSALGWGFTGFAVFFVLHLVAGLGMGDVKYAWPVCATLGWFGWDSLRVALFGVVIAGGIVGLIVSLQGKGRNHRVAYGPCMALGLTCGIVSGLLV